MDLTQITSHIEAYKADNQTIEAVNFMLHSFGLKSDYLEGFGFRDETYPNYVVLTTEGNFGGLQRIMIPKNLLDFDINLIINLLAHEMLHVRQKTSNPPMLDKNEREFLAYNEMLFHKNFPLIPDAPNFNRIQFCEKALEYYKRMGENSELQQKYAEEKTQVEELLMNLRSAISAVKTDKLA